MSDMSRPPSLPPAPNHEQHDLLLVSQYAANDPLGEQQQAEAASLAASCHHCAQLVADLRAVSGAVAWEPVPPRRRDFRIDAEQAEQLRGGRIQRFMRRLALPESTSLRPMAAGVMSLGLLMVVAGSVWPQTGRDVTLPAAAPVVVSTPNVFGQGQAEQDATSADLPDAALREGLTQEQERQAAATAAALPGVGEDGLAASELAQKAAPDTATAPNAEIAPDIDADAGPALDELEFAARSEVGAFADDNTPRDAAEQELDDAVRERAAESSGVSAPDPAADVAGGVYEERLDAGYAAPPGEPSSDLEGALGDEENADLRPDAAARANEASRKSVDQRDAETVEPAAIVGAVEATQPAGSRQVVEAAEMVDGDLLAGDRVETVPGDVTPDTDGISFETVLVVLGIVLAAAGLLLLVLVSVSRRRSADPFLR